MLKVKFDIENKYLKNKKLQTFNFINLTFFFDFDFYLSVTDFIILSSKIIQLWFFVIEHVL